MKKYIYWTKDGKFETFNFDEIPWGKLHSPTENTPALITSNGNKFWFYEGKQHRLTGPAILTITGKKSFRIHGEGYTFEEWLKNHPNQDNSFQTKMKLKYA